MQYNCGTDGWLTVPGARNGKMKHAVCGWTWSHDRKINCQLRAKDITHEVTGATWKSEDIVLDGGKWVRYYAVSNPKWLALVPQ